jgi:hypothetical protein
VSRELQLILKAGDQIIATEDAYFDYNEEVKAKRLLSQRKGDIIMVNNPMVTRNANGVITSIGDKVNGNGIYDGGGRPKGERPNKGLGCGLKVGTFRMATPDDPGYMATREQWDGHLSQRLKSERRQAFVATALLLLTLGLIAIHQAT